MYFLKGFWNTSQEDRPGFLLNKYREVRIQQHISFHVHLMKIQSEAYLQPYFSKLWNIIHSRLKYIFSQFIQHSTQRFFSYAADAFNFYQQNLAFPPFSLIGKLISKAIRKQALGIMIIPYCSTQNWFPAMVQCLIDFPMQFLSTMRSLLLPQDSSQTHPLIVKMILLPVPLSGHQSKQEIFQRKLAKLSAIHGDQNHEAIPRASPEMERNLCSMEKKSIYTLFYLCNTFTSNVRLKFAKNQTKAKENLEAKLKAKNL